MIYFLNSFKAKKRNKNEKSNFAMIDFWLLLNMIQNLRIYVLFQEIKKQFLCIFRRDFRINVFKDYLNFIDFYENSILTCLKKSAKLSIKSLENVKYTE